MLYVSYFLIFICCFLFQQSVENEMVYVNRVYQCEVVMTNHANSRVKYWAFRLRKNSVLFNVMHPWPRGSPWHSIVLLRSESQWGFDRDRGLAYITWMNPYYPWINSPCASDSYSAKHILKDVWKRYASSSNPNQYNPQARFTPVPMWLYFGQIKKGGLTLASRS